MNLILEARHRVIVIGVAIIAPAVAILAPHVLPIYPASAYAIPIIATALILNTLGVTAERGRGPLRFFAWSLLIGAAILSALPLRGVLKVPWQIYQILREAGSPLFSATWASANALGNYSEYDLIAMIVALALSLSCISLAVFLPVQAILRSHVRHRLKQVTTK